MDITGKKLGFIGVGNMGKAILNGVIQGRVFDCADINLYDVNPEKVREFADLRVNVLDSAAQLASQSDVVIIAVKPNDYKIILEQVREVIAPLYISISPGISIAKIRSYFANDPHAARILRAMPNTPLLIGQGMTVLCGAEVDSADVDLARQIFQSVGVVMELPESKMDAAVALASSSPAYVYMFIEALADAGVAAGLDRNASYTLAAQAVQGAARMVLETHEHPGLLKDRVCSPSGTTIRAVEALERGGFRYAVMSAVDACVKRCAELDSL